MDVFCKIIKGEIPSIKCYEDEDLISIMDINPVAPGHLMIIPKKHIENILEMPSETMKKIHEVSQNLIRKMESVYPNITGVRVVVNYGSLQEVKHYHMHLIPAYDEKPDMSQEEMAMLLKK